MPIHALLGATGSTGGAVLQYLLDEPIPNLELNICIRSKSKLLKSCPDLEATKAFKCKIIEAGLDDASALQECLTGAEVVYNCIASNDSAPGVSFAQEAARAIISTLKTNKQQQASAYIRPSILVNRSTTLNEALSKEAGFSKTVAHWALKYVYDDIAAACELFRRAHNEDLLDLICVDPPALHAGTKRTGYSLSLTENPFRSLNYPDLGAAFVEIAQEREAYNGKGVIVGATGDVEEHWDVLRGYLLRGAQARLIGV